MAPGAILLSEIVVWMDENRVEDRQAFIKQIFILDDTWLKWYADTKPSDRREKSDGRSGAV